MTKTLFHGSKKTVRRSRFDAGYAIFVATGLLCVLSFVSMGFLALARTKLDFVEKESARFSAKCAEENEAILREWSNSFETH
ncbi:MAG: hypothetical protein IJ158_04120 [Treponema sp.]|nr:hypothetical protein [Treponema sp.]